MPNESMHLEPLTSAVIVIVAGAGALYALFVYRAKVRGKRIGLVTFLAFIFTSQNQRTGQCSGLEEISVASERMHEENFML